MEMSRKLTAWALISAYRSMRVLARRRAVKSSLPTSLPFTPPNPALKRALALPAGRRWVYQVHRPSRPDYRARVCASPDPAGYTWLSTAEGARAGFTHDERGLVFTERSGPRDEFLDALALAIGLTHFQDGEVGWSGQLPVRLLGWGPLGTLRSTYTRHWDSQRQLWIQCGWHRSVFGQVRTRAELSESHGLVAFELHRGSARELCATLVGWTCGEGSRIALAHVAFGGSSEGVPGSPARR